jgi:SAM-dependent methyltransferase
MNPSSPNIPRFLANRYRESRPNYPRPVFELIERTLEKDASRRFLDLACGAGQSTRSFLALDRMREGVAMDRDPAMLHEARETLAADFPGIEFREGAAEAIPLPDASVDVVLVGSAIHWFDLDRAGPEIARVCRPGGILFVFEYQFPKCLDSPELAEIVRRRFNLEWKAPVQTPRGTLAELLAPFRRDPRWTFLGDSRPEWIETLSCEGFLGHLFSQSRYLHAEAAATDPSSYRDDTAAFFRPYFEGIPLRFDLKPRAMAFKRTAC